MLCERELNASASFVVPNNPSPTYGSTITTFLPPPPPAKENKKKKKKTTQSIGRLVLENTEN